MDTAAAKDKLCRHTPLWLASLAALGVLAFNVSVCALVGTPARAGPGRTGAAPFGSGLYEEEARGNDFGMDWRHCVQVVANLRAEPPDVPLVVLLGGSSARECTVLDADWAAQITRRGGPEVLAYNLGSKHRSYAQDLAFVKLLPRTPTIVYIGVNLGRFCLPPSSPTVRLPNPHPLASYPQHVYSRQRILSAAQKRSYVSYWIAQRWPELQTNYRYELGILEQIIRTCKRRHLRVVLLDLPRDLPIIGDAFDAPVARYHGGCSLLARRYDVPWVNFVAAAHLVDRDFFDLFHLVEPGRAKYQRLLSDQTIRLLKRYEMPAPAPSPTPTPTPMVTSSPTRPANVPRAERR